MKNIVNEWYKIYKGKRLGFFLLALLGITIAVAIIIKSLEIQGTMERKYIDDMIGGNFPLEVLGMIADIVLPIFVTMLATFLVTDEIDSGSMKLPLLCGQSRGKLITSKVIVVILGTMALMVFTYVITNILSAIIWGWELVLPALGDNAIIFTETFLALAGWAVIVLFISLFMKNSGVMVGVATFILVAGLILGSVSPKFASFEVMYYFKAFINVGQKINLALAMTVCFATMIVFYILSLVKFKRLQINK